MLSSHKNRAGDLHRAARINFYSAKIYARAGEYEAAIESLEAALAAGHTDTASWGDDTDLKELRGIPDFERLLGDATATS